MAKHTFGGDWTSDKLERVRRYLVEYTKIFNINKRARHFITTYVDAFAGTGYRLPSAPSKVPKPLAQSDPMFGELGEAENQAFLKGSARIALEVEPSFHKYIFIEQDRDRAAELTKLSAEFRLKSSRISIEVADANRFLMDWCKRTDWKQNRAVVFLDPYGLQVEWELLQEIARTKAIDLWLLFPLGMAVNRLLTKSEPPPDEWAQALTRTFGTDTWRQAFYPSTRRLTLFGEEDVQTRQANFEVIGKFFVERLKTIFTAVAERPLPLLNSKNVPLYLLCFAAGNQQGAGPAIRIAKYILEM